MSKVISGEQLGACHRLQLPNVGSGAAEGPSSGGGVITVEELHQIQRQAYEEAYAQGLEEGRAAGRDDIAQQARQLQDVLDKLGAPLAEVDDQVLEELVQLAVAVARHMVRRELKADPGQVVAIVREALEQLPVASTDVRLHLHPQDAALIRESLPLKDGETRWQIVESPVLSRGGCRVETGISQIDATVETRFAAIVAALMGGEREHDE